jgi:hypothetical protein
MEKEEKRKEPRYKVDASVEIKYQGKTVNGKAVEISKHGARLVCPAPIQPGAKIDAVIFLKDPERVSGEVKWAIAEPDPTQGTISYVIGVALREALVLPDDEL